jgi:gliding motility-associated-like protein
VRRYFKTYKASLASKIITCLLIGSLCSDVAHAKIDTLGLYVAPGGVMYLNNNAQIGVKINVINEGALGTKPGSILQMEGTIWRNTGTASFPDESGVNSFSGVGGVIRFAGNGQQYLTGGASIVGKTGPFIPHVTVANTSNLFLYQGDAMIRGSLTFERGILWLNDNNLLMGMNDPGTIAGYNENSFIATGNTVKGGYLYRSKISSATGAVVFPIGPQFGSYAPFSIMYNTNAPQDLHARSFDNVYRNAFAGPTGNPASLQQTWNIGQENTTAVPFLIAMQHTIQREGAAFTAHRSDSYISEYDFTKRAWDTVAVTPLINPGTITTGTPQSQTYIHTRSFGQMSQNSYYTKVAEVGRDSVTIGKGALTVVRQPDGSFRTTYLIFIRNTGGLPVHTIQVFDSLSKVFTAPATFTVASVSASGALVANDAYDGVANTDLLKPGSMLAPFTTDTITLVLNVITNKSGNTYYYNTAKLSALMSGFNGQQYHISNESVDGMAPPAPTTSPLPTPVIIGDPKYKIPEGFSPNNDGVNDKFIIGNLGNDVAAVTIFNKQGQQVYRSSNYHNDWDGFSNLGEKVLDGTYFYKIVITEGGTGKQETYYGFISLWR